jgi:hypothetical protein
MEEDVSLPGRRCFLPVEDIRLNERKCFFLPGRGCFFMFLFLESNIPLLGRERSYF